jgi:hypothetical protein
MTVQKDHDLTHGDEIAMAAYLDTEDAEARLLAVREAGGGQPSAVS